MFFEKLDLKFEFIISNNHVISSKFNIEGVPHQIKIVSTFIFETLDLKNKISSLSFFK
jgi:hypothetical protein